MVFKYVDAIKIVEEYKYLIGSRMDETSNEYIYDYLAVAPNYGEELDNFLGYFRQNLNAETSLIMSGFNKEEVIIIFICYKRYEGLVLYYDLDKYLKDHYIKRSYLGE